MAIEAASVESLQGNHEEEGDKMAASIVSWLDAEWIPQQVHIDMAQVAKNTYVTCRKAGDADVASIMMQIADDLNDSWKEFDADAFVNAWDIGNYCADYMTERAGIERCACSEVVMPTE
eukprot:CAMPEP_0195514102 /NCGR_PEP_ID=MMETSP0794_2-20130614/5591_1 /TAXON_ID=515487 /ORGANISM="Stephanopyxis turris, Strain CCMP 815" /LENGTH=118 /DNA_ID=CAMNT_0040642271 /DNA_START=291 /DNA_END=647 /DNA_ORIENTATION=-